MTTHWESWPWLWIALGLFVVAGALLLFRKGGSMNFWQRILSWFHKSPAAPVPSVPWAPPPAAAPVAPSPATAPASGGGTGYPRVETISGVNFNLKAPINPNWKPSQASWVFGHYPGVTVGDPSNGDLVVPPQALRSAAGYPLKYALGAGNMMIGTPSVLFADDAFNSDAEVAAAIAVTPVVLP